MNDTLQQLMHEATQLTRAGKLTEATEAIQRALRGRANPPADPAARAAGSASATAQADSDTAALVLDGCVFETDSAAAEPTHRPTPMPSSAPGQFIGGSHGHGSAVSPVLSYDLRQTK